MAIITSTSFLEARKNTVLHHNPPVAQNNITTHGSDWLWTVCTIHAFLLCIVVASNYRLEYRRRCFHYISISILLVTTIYYFIMASDLGSHGVPVEFRHNGISDRKRQVYYARWVGYFINFSFVNLALLLLSGVGWPTILFTIGWTEIWATMLLIGGLVRSTYKWGFFVFAVLSYFFIAWQLLGIARSWARRIDVWHHKMYTGLTGYILFIWMLYHLSWGLSEGGNVMQNDSETVFYGILDLFTQGFFAIILLFATDSMDFDRLRLSFAESGRLKEYSGIGPHSTSEKAARTPPAPTAGITAPAPAHAGYNDSAHGQSLDTGASGAIGKETAV